MIRWVSFEEIHCCVNLWKGHESFHCVLIDVLSYRSNGNAQDLSPFFGNHDKKQKASPLGTLSILNLFLSKINVVWCCVVWMDMICDSETCLHSSCLLRDVGLSAASSAKAPESHAWSLNNSGCS